MKESELLIDRMETTHEELMDVDHGRTCGECQSENVTVTYTHTESWGDPEHPTGTVEFWYCDDCLPRVS